MSAEIVTREGADAFCTKVTQSTESGINAFQTTP